MGLIFLIFNCAHQWCSAWRKYAMTVLSRVRGYLTTVVFSSYQGWTVWSSRQPKPRWAVSTSLLKKTAVAPTATSTPTRTAPRRCRSTGETGSQLCLLKICICGFVYVGYVCAVLFPDFSCLLAVILKSLHWYRRWESELSPWTQPGQEEVWDWIRKSAGPSSLFISVNTEIILLYFLLIPLHIFLPLLSTRATPRLACLSSTWATPSWAVASWGCPTPWPTLASRCLCKCKLSWKLIGFGGAKKKLLLGTMAWFAVTKQQVVEAQSKSELTALTQGSQKGSSWGKWWQVWFCHLRQDCKAASFQMHLAAAEAYRGSRR